MDKFIKDNLIELNQVNNFNEFAIQLGYKNQEEFDLYNDTTTNFHLLYNPNNDILKKFKEDFMEAVFSPDISVRIQCKSKHILEKVIAYYHMEERLKEFSKMSHNERLEFNLKEQREIYSQISNNIAKQKKKI